MYYLIAFLLVGTSFAPLLFQTVSMWQAQGFFVAIMIGLCFSATLFEKPKYYSRNTPLSLLHAWLVISTAIIWYASMKIGEYNIVAFFAYFNFLCLLMMYHFITQYLDRVKVEKILDWMRLVVIVTMFVTVLQIFDLSQFFKLDIELYPETAEINHSFNNLAIGFMGNGTLLSSFLAITTPLFLRKITRENVLCLLLMIVLFFHTGTTLGDPSVSGFIIMSILLGLFCWHKKCLIQFSLCLTAILAIAYMFFDTGNIKDFISFKSRGNWIAYYYDFFKNGDREILGYGLGTILRMRDGTPFPSARWLHFEYFQFLLELGIIGLVLVVNLIRSFLTTRIMCHTQFILKLAIIGFLISCFINPMAHLWLSTTWVMAFYAFFTIYNQKEIQK